MKLCDYGCGKEGKYRFKNGKWCCSKNWQSCLNFRSKIIGKNNPFYGKTHSIQTIEKQRTIKLGKNNPFYGKTHSKESKKKMQKKKKGKSWAEIYGKEKSEKMIKKVEGVNNQNFLTISKIKKRYPLFSQIEELRYNPDKPNEKEIQVHCKYNECKNSKEKSGWFTPTRGQLSHRIYTLENPKGFGESNFYCSKECKKKCILFNLHSDPYDKSEYSREVQPELRELRLEIDNYQCQKCGKTIDEVELHCHHLEGIRWEPLESADLDKVITLCKNCHIEVHKIEGCSYSDLQCKYIQIRRIPCLDVLY